MRFASALRVRVCVLVSAIKLLVSSTVGSDDKQYTIYNNSSVSRDSYGSRSTTNNCKARMVARVHSSGGTDSI